MPEKYWSPSPKQLAQLAEIEESFQGKHGRVETKHLLSLIEQEIKMTIRVYGKKVFFPMPWHKEREKAEAREAYAKRMIRLRRLLEIVQPKQETLF